MEGKGNLFVAVDTQAVYVELCIGRFKSWEYQAM
jgi:hypothetical protein